MVVLVLAPVWGKKGGEPGLAVGAEGGESAVAVVGREQLGRVLYAGDVLFGSDASGL